MQAASTPSSMSLSEMEQLLRKMGLISVAFVKSNCLFQAKMLELLWLLDVPFLLSSASRLMRSRSLAPWEAPLFAPDSNCKRDGELNFLSNDHVLLEENCALTLTCSLFQ